MPEKRVTIREVAAHAGVGLQTVSRVVNGGKYVRRETAERVNNAIRALSYEPNEAARMLKGQRPKLIGLIIPDLADPFFAVGAHAVQSTLARSGYMTSVLSAERSETFEVNEVTLMSSRQIAGLLVVPTSHSVSKPMRAAHARGLPIVAFDRPVADYPSVLVDNRAGSKRAIQHLLDHGYREILCVGYDEDVWPIAERIAGYREVMESAGIKPKFLLRPTLAEVRTAIQSAAKSRKHPRAIFTLNNITTTEVLRICSASGLKVPQEVALIGFDDFATADMLAVPVTVVRQPVSEMGTAAAEIMLDLIKSPGMEIEGRSFPVTLPTELVLRKSCGCS